MVFNPKFTAFQPLYGFDDSVHPCWQMIPLDGEKNVYLDDAAETTVEIVNPKIAAVSEIAPDNLPGRQKRLFKIIGKSYGNTFLEVRKDGIPKTKLEISVKTLKSVGLSFNFVTDKTGRTTDKNSSNVLTWVKALNEIYEPQTNITFVHRSTRLVTINNNLGSEIDSIDAKSDIGWEWEAVVKERDASADVNIFLVWKINQSSSQETSFPKGITWEKDCMISDYKKTTLELEIIAIAHEIGHALGIPGEQHFTHPKNRGKFVMYYSSKLSGPRLPKIHAEMVNP